MEVIGVKFRPVLDGSGGVEIKPVNNTNTVDFDELQKRFKAFDIAWPQVSIGKLKTLRNNLEHFHLTEPIQAVQEAIAQSFPMVDELFKLLRRDPAVELGEAWQVMLEERAFFLAQKADCDASLAELRWLSGITAHEYFSCPKCGSPLIEQRDRSNSLPQDIQGRCRGCGAALNAEEVVELVVDAQYGAEAHYAAKRGGEDVISACHDCGQDAYVSSSDGVNGCFWCECSLSGECALCRIGLTPNNVSEDNPALCGYCHNLMLKD